MRLRGSPKSNSLAPVFARLKLTLLRNGLRADRRAQLGTIGMALLSVVGGLTAAYSFVRDAHDVPLAWSRSLVPGFTVIFLAWVFGPLLLGGVDDAADPRRLLLLPIAKSELVRGLMVGAMVGFLPIGTVLALSGVAVGYSSSIVAATVVGLACVVELVLVFSVGRLLSVALALSARSRRGKDIGVLLASVAAAVLWIATQSLIALDDEAVDRINRVLSWLPPGMLGRAVIEARVGAYGVASLRIAGVAIVAAFSFFWWARLLASLLVSPVSVRIDSRQTVRPHRVEDRVASLVSFIGGPLAGVVFTKELRYLRRSPSRRSALVISMVMGAPFVVLQVLRTGGFRPGVVVLAPIAMIFGLGAVNNLLGNDGPSLWLEVTSGAKLRELLIGRGAAAIPFLVIPPTITALFLVVASRSLLFAPEVFVFLWASWGIPLGIGTYLSTVAPFSQTDDVNPFSNVRATSGSGLLVMFVALIAIIASFLAALPIVMVMQTIEPWGSVRFAVMIVFCLTYGTLFWVGGVGLATRRVRRRGIDLLGLLTPRSAHS